MAGPVAKSWRCLLPTALLLLGPSVDPAFAEKDYGRVDKCLSAVQRYLQEADVDLATVESIDVRVQFRFNKERDEVVQGYQAWVRTKEVNGAIVLLLRNSCDLWNSWTTGDQDFSLPDKRKQAASLDHHDSPDRATNVQSVIRSHPYRL